MELKASDIQKQRIKEIEEKADELVQKCSIMFGQHIPLPDISFQILPAEYKLPHIRKCQIW